MSFFSTSTVNLAFGVIKTPKRRFISLSITCLCVTELLKRKWEIFSKFKAPKFVQSKVSLDVWSCRGGLPSVRPISENFRVTLGPFGSTSSVYISRVVDVQFPTAVLYLTLPKMNGYLLCILPLIAFPNSK